MTAYEMRISDWSSDVCSSDLAERGRRRRADRDPRRAARLPSTGAPGGLAERRLQLQDRVHRARPEAREVEWKGVGMGQRAFVRVERDGRGIITNTKEHTEYRIYILINQQ